ncbi:hypothetical protein H920_11852 [Fukomys damarensis]|uniref:Uncharacterized protein n=1 Tax=Fukomys damarensis TaxID=885580 RepID=A0A091D3U3_FUKDA|nr:hypothetical protein H920_11852 [Fukomys damarensis]
MTSSHPQLTRGRWDQGRGLRDKQPRILDSLLAVTTEKTAALKKDEDRTIPSQRVSDKGEPTRAHRTTEAFCTALRSKGRRTQPRRSRDTLRPDSLSKAPPTPVARGLRCRRCCCCGCPEINHNGAREARLVGSLVPPGCLWLPLPRWAPGSTRTRRSSTRDPRWLRSPGDRSVSGKSRLCFRVPPPFVIVE